MWICTWTARYNTWLLIKLTPKGVVFSFLSEDLQLIDGRMQRVSRYQWQMSSMRGRKGGAGNELQARMVA